MNADKLLIKLTKVPKTVSIGALWREITNLMGYSYMAANDLAGIFVDVDLMRPQKAPNWFIYFFRINSIGKFKRLCNNENEKLVLYLFNSKIEVEMPGRDFWTLSTELNRNYVRSDAEIKVKTTKYQAIIDIIKVLGRRLTMPYENHHPIESCVQAKEMIFIKFSRAEYASRALVELYNQGYEAKRTISYTFLSLECNEEPNPQESRKESTTTEKERNKNKTQEPTPSTSKDKESVALTLSKKQIDDKSRERIIHVGSINMRTLIKKFTVHDRIYFALTDIHKSNEDPDHDVVILNEDVEMPEII